MSSFANNEDKTDLSDKNTATDAFLSGEIDVPAVDVVGLQEQAYQNSLEEAELTKRYPTSDAEQTEQAVNALNKALTAG